MSNCEYAFSGEHTASIISSSKVLMMRKPASSNRFPFRRRFWNTRLNPAATCCWQYARMPGFRDAAIWNRGLT